MSTKEEKETLRVLVQYVSRAFYEPKYTIIMDQLARYPVLKDDELAGRMGLQPKELNKVIAVLSNDCLVKVYRQNELKEGAQRSVGKQYYYIDYEHFCNVVKWRIAKMWNKIDHKLRNEIDNKGYICPQCKASYTPLEVDKVMDFIRGIFVCEICQHELVENEDAESVQGSKDRMMRFNHQMRFIREGLQKSETMTLPQFDVAAWVKSHAQAELEQKQKMANGGVGGGGENGMNGVGVGLKVAGADSNGKREEGIGILMVMDGDGDDEDKRRREREKEAEQKRAQNALPSWHLKSTITGDLTALGVKESARAAAAAQARDQLGLGDESLRGLGVAGLPKSRHASASSLSLPTASSLKPEDASSTADQEAELYEQYYASLAANSSYSGSTPVSTTATPSATVPSEYGVDIDEEEDRKPTIQYLDSLSEYRKRSRSIDDVGTGGPRTPKIAKTDSSSSLGGLTNGFGNVSVEYPSSSFLSAYEEPPPPSQPAGGDPLVYVNGVAKPLSLITEEDHDLMTPEEYTAYFQILEENS